MNVSQRKKLVDKFNIYEIPAKKFDDPNRAVTMDTNPNDAIHMTQIVIGHLPKSINAEMVKAAANLVNDGKAIMKGFGNIYYCESKKDKDRPHQVLTDVTKLSFVCKSQNCYRFQSFGICKHTLAIACKTDSLREYTRKVNTKGKVNISRLCDVGKEKNAGKKKRKATEIRKGPANKLHIPTKVIVQPAQLHPSSSDSSLEQPSPNQVAEDSNENENLIIPDTPNPSPNGYELTLLKFCHKNVAKCSGCSGNFFENGYPAVPFDLVVVSKTKRDYVDPKTRQKTKSPDFTKVYYHFHSECLLKHNSFFAPQLICIPPAIKEHLSAIHKGFLSSLSVIV